MDESFFDKCYRRKSYTFSEEWKKSDVALHVNGAVFHAHSNILRIASNKFNELIQKCNGKNEIKIVIDNVKQETI